MAAPLLALATSARSFGRGLALSVVLLGLLQPRAFVFCRAESGHAEMEALEDGCCAGAGLGTTCVPAAPGAGAGDDESMESDPCRDVLVEAPARLPHDGRPEAVPAAEAERAPVAAPSGPARAPRGRDADARAAAHERILTTVLRN